MESGESYRRDILGPSRYSRGVGIVAYWFALTPSLSNVHDVFHFSMLWKYIPDPTHVVDWGEFVVDTDGTFEEGPVHIMDSQDQVLLLISTQKVLF